MGYALFLDDERHPSLPPPGGGEWVVCRSFSQAVMRLHFLGAPEYVSFDHDLTHRGPTGYDFAKLLVETDIEDGGGFLPAGFSFGVHSANPIGRGNIEGLLSGYLSFRKNS